METLKFMAKGQKLIRLEIKPIYSGVRNYMEAEFILNHSWYNITPLVAQFKKDERLFHVTLKSGKCTVPWEVLENAGTIEISLTGGNLLVTNPVKVTVNDSGAEGGLVPTEASNSLYSEIMEKLNSIEEDWLNCKSLLAEYEQNISDSESAVEDKITDFETKSDELSRKISEINVLAEKCKNDSQTAQALYEKVKEKIETAKKSIDTLVEKITLAENTKSSLEESISKGENTKAVLDSTITSAENIKAELKLEDCISENERAEKNIEQLKSGNFNAEEILYGVEDLKKYTGYSGNGVCYFAKVDLSEEAITQCLDKSIKAVDLSKGYNGIAIKKIGDYAFSDCYNMSKFVFGTDITSIGKGAFYGSNLSEDVVIPPNITEIGENAFKYTNANIYNLSDAEITEGVHCENGSIVPVTVSGSLTGNVSFCLVDKYFALKGTGTTANANIDLYKDYLDRIEEVYIQDGIKTIATSMFNGCTSIRKVSLPSGITDIGYRAFKGCTALEEIDLPVGLKNIVSAAFSGCTGLKEVVIPTGVTTIRDNLFANCLALKSVNIPKTVTTIESSAFYSCSNLENVETLENVVNIGSYAFFATSLEAIVIGDKIESIDENAFRGCNKLKTIKLKKTKDSIEGSPWGASKAEIIWEE